MTSEVGVPGVGVHQVAVAGGRRDLQVGAEHAERGVGTGQPGIGGVRGDRQPRDVGGPAEGVDPHVDPGALQRRSEVLHVHPGPSVDLMGPLTGQESDAQRIFSRVNVHDGTVVRKSPGVETRS